ncbi:unnamed protein product [Chilo suppressalis]|uniref:ATP synthase-coupling factor 6, mitochondrial n=1 Tax=Chilo suppressalis TaxID=168631 RepID=A0ABN8AWQ5_CHISP|nr:unnamed protein product [Chilo suppressalis]
MSGMRTALQAASELSGFACKHLVRLKDFVSTAKIVLILSKFPKTVYTEKMLSSSLLCGLRAVRSSVVITRNLAAAQKATDPIQQLFLDKVREYKQKSAGGKLVEASPEIERELKAELDKLEKQYGGGSGVDMTAFPSFKFEEPKLDPIDEVKK